MQLAPLAGLLVSAHAGNDKENWGLTGTGASTLWTTVVVPTYTTYCEVSRFQSLRHLSCCAFFSLTLALVAHHLGLHEHHLHRDRSHYDHVA